MSEKHICPQCQQLLTQIGKHWICLEHGQVTLEKPFTPLRIFLSYGHDANEELVQRIKADLEKRGHDLWFDKSEIKFGEDWRRAITDGIVDSNRVLSFLSKYSTRDPGVCLDEIGVAISVKGGNIQTILVESETEVKPPPSIGHIQWLDMHDWQEQRAKDEVVWERWYQNKLAEIVRVVESDESRRFAGEIDTLKDCLKPISSDSRISALLQKRFVGRTWIVDAIEEWRNASDRDSRLFWIMGDPGVGKSAFAANLTHFGRDKVIAAQFVEWDKPDHKSAQRVVRSLAFQLATRLPDYRKLLLTLPEIAELDQKEPTELFDYLLANPLRPVIDSGRERYLIVIDALDEAGEAGRNSLVEMLARNAAHLPDWLGIVVTSRPECSVSTPLQGLNPFVLDTQTKENRTDISDYLRHKLSTQLNDRGDSNRILEQILEKSEGVFLYVEHVCQNIQKGFLSLDELEQFPQGLGGVFFQFFDRQFPDLETFRKDVRPALRAILAASEPLPVEILQQLFSWQDEELRDFVRTLGSLFPVMSDTGTEVIKTYHKSLAEWLTDEAKAGVYFVSLKEGHRLLATAGWQAFESGDWNPIPYFTAKLPHHLLVCEEWAKIESLLSDIRFLESKVAAGLSFEIPQDFREAIELLPIERPQRIILILLEEALRRDLHFIARHANDYPQGLFQCLWNTGWWYDCQEVANHYQIKKNLMGISAHKVSKLLEQWREQKELATPTFCWIRAQRPPLMRLNSTQLAVLFGHDDHVRGVSYSPCGHRIVSGSDDKTVRVWDANSGAQIALLRGHNGGVSSVSYSPDGHRIVSGSFDCTVRVWSAKSYAELLLLRGHESSVRSVCHSPDGQRIASGSDDKTVRVWDAKTGMPLAVLCGHDDHVRGVSYSPCGHRIVSGSADKTVRVWDANSGAQIALLRGHDARVSSVGYSPDGQRIASGSEDMTVRVWDSNTGTLATVLRGHEWHVTCVQYSPDGQFIISTGSFDGTVRVWNANTGAQLTVLRGHDRQVNTVSCSPRGQRIVSGSHDKSIRVWDINNRAIAALLIGHDSAISSVSYTPCGQNLFSTSYDSTVRVWDSKSGAQTRLLRKHNQGVFVARYSPDGLRIACGTLDGEVRVSDTTSGMNIVFLSRHEDKVSSLDFSPNGLRIVSGSDDETLRLWDALTGVELFALHGHEWSVTCVQYSPDGRNVISGSFDGTVRIWDAIRGRILAVLDMHEDVVNCISYSPNGQEIVSGSDDMTIRIWDATNGEELALLRGHNNNVTNVCYSPCGRRIVSTSADNTLRVWDAQSYECLKVIHGCGDAAAIARGPMAFPFRLLARGLEAVIEEATTDNAIAWLPLQLDHINTHPLGRQWAGASANHLVLFQLEKGIEQ